MIFLTCLTIESRRSNYNFQDALNQYIFLVKSIMKFHPEAKIVLKIMDATPINENYDPELFDLNRLEIAKELLESNEPIILIDADCLICKKLDPFFQNDLIDATYTMRGKMGNGENINFGVSIYHNKLHCRILINKIRNKVLKSPFEDKRWNEVQPVLPEIFTDIKPTIFDDWNKEEINPARIVPNYGNEHYLRLIDSKLLNCTTEKDYSNAFIIHYKNKKNHAEELYNKFVLRKSNAN